MRGRGRLEPACRVEPWIRPGYRVAERVSSALLVPLLVKERAMEVVSLLEARDWERSPFMPRKVGLCEAMASGAGIAIENALRFEERERPAWPPSPPSSTTSDRSQHRRQSWAVAPEEIARLAGRNSRRRRWRRF